MKINNNQIGLNIIYEESISNWQCIHVTKKSGHKIEIKICLMLVPKNENK